MKSSRWVALLAAAVLAAAPVCAQVPPPPPPPTEAPPSSGAAPIPQDLLDSLLAPIALYPDELLTQILMASTYPLEVVEAARFVKANPNLKGPALENALKDKSWDPSVLSLTSFPQVLDMMNDKLEWTQRLGDAFLQDEAAVMRTVQSLRMRAQQAGNLQSTPQQQVVVQDRYIYIQPAQPQYVYVPVYNPAVIYGPWWAPAYTPWFWYPPPVWGYPPYYGGALAVGFVWGAAWAISVNNWGWCHPNWHSGNVNININNNNVWVNRPQYRDEYRSNGNWRHDVDHRRGVAYRDTATGERYRPSSGAGVRTRENYRGRDTATRPAGGGGAGNVTRPSQPVASQRPAQPSAAQRPTQPAASQRPAQPATAQRPSEPMAAQRPSASGTRPSPAYQPESRPQVQHEAQRGAQSRAAMQRPTSNVSRGGGAGAGRATGRGR
ncbi:MAG TPA: DUF3300 domain-containing protein [Burkholderiaceae bacterium]|nr:DUF3300 domain-containing protein [Burkholderiaceae bacterium]